MTERATTHIQSVARACKLLLYVSERPSGAAAREIADAHGMALPTVHHLLNTLVAEGMLAKDSQRRYSVGPKVGALADAFNRQLSPPEYLLLPLHQLAETIGESAYLTAWRSDEIVVLASIEGERAVRVGGLHTGAYANGHARATGKLLLALAREEVREAYLRKNPLKALTPRTITDRGEFERELREIRERGYAYEQEEFSEGVGCVAAPVVENGVAIAAYTISAPIQRFAERRQSLTEAVLHTAQAATSAARAGVAPAAG